MRFKGLEAATELSRALQERKGAEGAEIPTIIGLLRDPVERDDERLRPEQQKRYQRWCEADRIAREQRLL